MDVLSICSMSLFPDMHGNINFDINRTLHEILQWCHKGAMVSGITSLTIGYSTVYSGTDQRKHQSSASLAFVWGIHRSPVNSPHKWPVTRNMFPFDDFNMNMSKHSSGALLKRFDRWHPTVNGVSRAFVVMVLLSSGVYIATKRRRASHL